MNIHEKVRLMRESKHWSQEKMAEQLHMSPNGYAKIERGETKLHIDKLQQIAQVLDVDIFELMTFGESGVCVYVNSNNEHKEHSVATYHGISNPILASEIDKLNLIISHQKELLTQKQSEIDTLKDMILLLKTPADRP
ncbi:helix-turn-helix domain-containing protein [Moraxella sp. VT-16-12]|uniref:helix-turn-helix domain-containing protein n=1 Tax=Moraxella sp. VT-16-12 TaxID=2014877 RepID=UPI000B7FF5EC|nr:helix-turn-helix transcriptional regulator [Moraxella sp. VT-16-12]TWV81348.1 helix-turn-helix transcriptional regulator [Moraxella sp. VT-16-12]